MSEKRFRMSYSDIENNVATLEFETEKYKWVLQKLYLYLMYKSDAERIECLKNILKDDNISNPKSVKEGLIRVIQELNETEEQLQKVKQCNNCKHWRLGTASLDDNYCNLTGEWSDYEGYCDNWKGYSND